MEQTTVIHLLTECCYTMCQIDSRVRFKWRYRGPGPSPATKQFQFYFSLMIDGYETTT